jgi:hypothetical protein
VYKGLFICNNVRRRDSVLQRFVEYLDEIRMLLTSKKLSFQELYDVVWICRLMFSQIFPCI